MTKHSSSDIGGINVTWVPYVHGQQSAPAHSMIERLVLRRIDGRRTVAQILDLFPGQQEALQALSRLLQDGTLKVLEGRETQTRPAPPEPTQPPQEMPAPNPVAAFQPAPEAVAEPAPVAAPVAPSAPPALATPDVAAPAMPVPEVPAGEQPLSAEVMQNFRTRLTAHTGPVSRLLLRDAYAAAGSQGEQLYPSQLAAFSRALLKVSPPSCQQAVEALLKELQTQGR